MAIELDPHAIRTAWRWVCEEAKTDLQVSRRIHDEAAGSDMEDLTACLEAAVRDIKGITRTAFDLINELGDGVDQCLQLWEETEHQAVGEFNALQAPLS